jgi:hypothetical protein
LLPRDSPNSFRIFSIDLFSFGSVWIQKVFVSFVLAGNIAAADRRRPPISTNGKGVVDEEGDNVLGIGTVVLPSHLQ